MPLTKFKSGITILTEKIANSLFGGLYGSEEATRLGLSETDPLVAGHIHDGQHLDGHAQKINLADHVTGQLDGDNILDSSIPLEKLTDDILSLGGAPLNATYVVVSSSSPLTDERVLQVTAADLSLTDGGAGNSLTLSLANTAVTPGSYTYSGLTVDQRGRVTSISSGTPPAFSTTSNITSNSPGTLSTDDFVFGSSVLVDNGNTDHDKRMFFDKSQAAFRAGYVTGTEWDTRGLASVGFGFNTIALGDYSFVSGSTNTISSSATYSSILGGLSNTITDSPYSIILGGNTNEINTVGEGNVIISGESTSIVATGNNNVVLGGFDSVVNGTVSNSVTIGQRANTITNGAFVIGGSDFPNDTSGVRGQAQVSEHIFMAEVTTPPVINMTLDGNAISTDNILYLPQNSAAYIICNWVGYALDTGDAVVAGGTTTAIAYRRTSGTLVVNNAAVEIKDTTPTNNNTNLSYVESTNNEAAGTDQVILFAATGSNGGLVPQIQVGLAAFEYLVVAHVKVIQIRNNGWIVP